MNRFHLLMNELLRLSEGAPEKTYRVTLRLLSHEKEELDKAGELRVSRESIHHVRPYFSIENFMLDMYSNEWEAEFKKGKNSALSEICKIPGAINYEWVRDAINELWKNGDQKTVRKLFYQMVISHGKRPFQNTIKDLIRDRALYRKFLAIRRRETFEASLTTLSGNEGIGEETLRQICREFKSIEKEYRILRSNWRAGTPPKEEEISIIGKEVLGLHAFLKEMPAEFETYKQIREKRGRVDFAHPRNLVTKIPRKRRQPQTWSIILRDIKKKYGWDKDRVSELYKDYLSAERRQNEYAEEDNRIEPFPD